MLGLEVQERGTEQFFGTHHFNFVNFLVGCEVYIQNCLLEEFKVSLPVEYKNALNNLLRDVNLSEFTAQYKSIE